MSQEGSNCMSSRSAVNQKSCNGAVVSNGHRRWHWHHEALLPVHMGASAASGVGVGSAVNRLSDELAMVAVVCGLREALAASVASRV